MFFNVLFAYIHRLRQRKTETAALTHGVSDYSLVRAELLAGLVNKIALREFFSGVFFYEGAVISVGDEAYILAVMLFLRL